MIHETQLGFPHFSQLSELELELKLQLEPTRACLGASLASSCAGVGTRAPNCHWLEPEPMATLRVFQLTLVAMKGFYVLRH